MDLVQLHLLQTITALVPVVEYSYWTPEPGGYELGVVGTDWALTFKVPEDSFLGKVQAKGAVFSRPEYA
jgi:hypothetical protein